jgi:hypothetical protein
VNPGGISGREGEEMLLEPVEVAMDDEGLPLGLDPSGLPRGR